MGIVLSYGRSVRTGALLVALALVGGACSTASSMASGRRLRVVAAENFWGSIARQLGGDKVAVQSIIDNPDTDPHDYEPTAADARAVASANDVIVNGIGYDPWADKLLKANPDKDRAVLNVGVLVGVKSGGNPHRWYSPPDVQRVVDRITADYRRLSPKDGAYFDQQKATLNSTGLARYNALIAEIEAKHRGAKVGASESVFSPLAEALDLDLITPPPFLTAAIQAHDAAVRLGGRLVWEHLDLSVRAGEFVAVLGPNGAGKSTLVNAVLGLVPLAAGTLTVLGASPGTRNPDIGYLPQRRSFDAGLRVRGVDVVRLGLDGDRWGLPRPGRGRNRETRQRVAEVIDLVDASAYADRP